MNSSKLGLHLNASTRLATWPGTVLLLDPSAEWVREVYGLSPRTLIVARHNFEPSQPLDDPVRNAHEAYAKIRARALATKGMAYWQLYNEVGCDSVAGLDLLRQFTVAALDLAEADGVKLAIMAASTGTPKRPDETPLPWAAFIGAVRRAISGDHVLLVHEYGPRSVMEGQGWHVGRFREARRHIPELATVRTIVTETGIDGGSYPYNLPRDKAGWRNVPGLTAKAYMAQLAEADALYSDCANVLGLCVFCVGSGGGWASFAIDPELMPLLNDYWRTNPPLYPSTVPVEPLPPPTTTKPPKPQEPPMAFNTNPNNKSIYEPGAINTLAKKAQYIFVSDEVTGGGATGGNVVQATLQDPKTQSNYLAVWSPGFAAAGLLGPLAAGQPGATLAAMVETPTPTTGLSKSPTGRTPSPS